MEIELLYINECPSYPLALKLLKEVLDEEQVGASIKLRCIGTNREAGESKFPGSPTIRINGVDIEIGPEGRSDYALSCRVYQEGEKRSGVPSKKMIRQALRRAAEPRFPPGCC